MSGLRRLATTAAFMTLCGISLYGGLEAVRLGTRHRDFAPTEDFLSSRADRLLRDEVFSEDLPDQSSDRQRELALRLEQRLLEGNWKIATRRVRNRQQTQLGRNLFVLARAWLEAKREHFQQLPPAESGAFVAAEAEKLKLLAERGQSLPESDREAYLEGMIAVLEQTQQGDDLKSNSMWPAVMRSTATEGMQWWSKLDSDEQRQWKNFAAQFLSHMPPEWIVKYLSWRNTLSGAENRRGN